MPAPLREPLPESVNEYNWDRLTSHLNYSAKAEQIIREQLRGPRESSSIPLFGVEFETSCDYPVRDVVKSFGRPFAICKKDSSINSTHQYNYEIVTTPASLRMQRIHWKNFFKHLDMGYFSDSPNVGGVHVHISRNLMDESHMRRFCWFFVSPYNAKFIFKLSERRLDTLNRWCSFPQFQRNERNYRKLSQLMTILPDFLNTKYSICNTSPRHTVEIRAFASVAKQTNLLKNIEIVDAAFHFTKDRSINSLDVNSFFEWLDTLPRNKYFYLKKFIRENGGRDAYIAEWTRGLTQRQLLNVEFDAAIHGNLAA